MYKSATPLPASDMKDVFPEAKGKKEITVKTLMETIWKSSACYFKFRKNARNPGKKKYYTREGISL